MSLACRFCKCVEGDPCRLESGEECILMVDREYCTNPLCIMAADREKKNIRRAKQDKIRAEVKPIRERWFEERRRKDLAMARKRRRKTKGRAA